MNFDKLGLPYLQEEGIDSLQLLGIYFINVYFYKLMVDADFAKRHPARSRREDEALPEYDDYLTRHNNLYRAVLEENEVEYIQESDIYFYDKIRSMTWGSSKLAIHPIANPRYVDKKNIISAMNALLLYGFTDILKAQEVNNSITLLNLVNQRCFKVATYLSDALLLVRSLLPFNRDNVAFELAVAKRIKPTFLSKLACKLFPYKPELAWHATLKYIKGA